MKKPKKPWSMDPIEKNRERVWFFSVQSKFKDNMMEIFVPWNESNLVRLLSQIFSGRESVVKLFDFRILSTLLIRDIRIFVFKRQARKAVMIIALPLLFYFLSTRALIERDKSSYNLMKIFPSVQHFGARKENLLLVPHLFMSLPKDKRRYQRRFLDPKKHVWILSRSNTNLNHKNDRILKNQGTISWESPSEKELNNIEWEIDSSWEQLENLDERRKSVLIKNSVIDIEALESKIEQLEKNLVQTEELDFSSKSEQYIIVERKKRVKEIEGYKEEIQAIKRAMDKLEKQNPMQQEEIEQKESDRTKESYSFSESKFLKGFFDDLSIDESCISINYTKKPGEKFKLLKRRQDAFQYFRGLEKNRIADLWKVKTFLKNPSVNYDILSDPGSDIRKDINQFNSIRFMNQNFSRSSSSCDQNKEQLKLNKEQLRLNDDFRLKNFLLKITDQFTLSITKPGQGYSDEIVYDEIILNVDLESETALDKYAFPKLFQKYSLEWKKVFKRFYIQLIDTKNIYSFELAKIIHQYYFQKMANEYFLEFNFEKFYWKFQKIANKYYLEFNLEFQKIVNKYYLEFNLEFHYLEFQKIVNKYYLEFQKIVNKYYLEFNLEFHYLEFQKIVNKYYLEFQKIVNKYYLEFQKIVNKYYLEFNLEFQKIVNKYYFYLEFNLEFQKIVNKYYLEFNKYYLEFDLEFQILLDRIYLIILERIYLIKTLSRNLKDPIRTNWIKLNNVTQDAITQHSSSWRICQKKRLNRSILRTFDKKKNNTFVLSIQIEYFQQRLEYLLSISKQNNFKNRVFNPIELWTTQHRGWFGNPNKIFENQIYKVISDKIQFYKIIWDEIVNPQREKKSIPNLESPRMNQKTLVRSGLDKNKPINELIIDVFDNGKSYMELSSLSAIFDNWLNPLKLSNQNSLRASFCKANTLEFLDYLHRPRFNYKKRLASYIERIHIKNKNITYGQLLNLVPNLVPIHNNPLSLYIAEIRAVYSEKETISLIKSQVNILLDKYLRDQALIHDSHQSSNLLHKLNLLIDSNIEISIIDLSKYPLIRPQIVNFDKKSCHPFLKTSDQYSKDKNSFSSNIDLIQTQSYPDDLLSEISLRMNKLGEKEESFKNIMEDKAIGNLLNKEELKFLVSELKFLVSFKTLQINILFEKWGLFQTYRSWLWLFTSTGWKYAKNMFLATFPEIPINISDQLVSIPRNIRQNWNQNLTILSALSHQFWTLIKWEFREKILSKLYLILSKLYFVLVSRWHWDIPALLKYINESAVAGKDRSISFDIWKYCISNVREYDIFLSIFIGFFFCMSCIIPSQLILFYRNVWLIRDLQYNSYCFEKVGIMIRSFRKLRNVTNLNWYGSWLTFLDYAEKDSDPDDVGLSLLLKIWYVKNIKWRLLSFNGLRYSKFIPSIEKTVKKVLYECDLDDFLLRENRLLLVQEQISQFESKLTPPIGFFHEYFEQRKQPGLVYFRYLAEFIQRGLTHRIGVMNSELNSLFLAEMPIFAAFYQKMTSMPIDSSLSDQVRFYPLYPVPSLSNRILLIGPKETGRSYLAKSLAADSYLPLIRISPKSFLRQRKLLPRYESEYTSSAQQSYLEHENILRSLGWSGRPKDVYEKAHYDKKPHKFLYTRGEDSNPPEYFARRVIQFVFALKLAKLMSPCVIWIPSIHELNDYFFLIALLLELLGDAYNAIDGEKETTIKQNIVVIASTHIPKKIDPLLITPPRSKRRFDTFINTKNLPAPHREKEFPLLLRNKRLYLKKEWNCFDEFGLTTKGFTTLDLAKLADDLLLISMSQNTSAIDNDIIGVALYRSSWGPCNSNLKFSEFFKGLPYKIGKAIIQNKLTYLKNSLRLTLDFQGRRANYLHQWYLEPSIAGTAAKEFTIFYHILGCLAGSVAQDCWFLSESNKENWSPFDPFIANDFILASSLLQGLLEEFPSLAIYRGNSNYITIAPQFKRDTMQKGLSSILDEIVLSKELRNSYVEEETSIVCDSRTWRFSFIRSNRFEHIKDITIENPLLDYLHLFGRFQERPTRLSSLYWKKFLMSNPGFQPLYAAKDDIVERKTAAFWEAKLLYNKFQRMGIYQFDTEEYATEYKPLNTPVIYLARRFLWDPVSIRFLNKHSAFERGELFVSKELVKTIYLTYSSTRELKYSIKKKLKAILKRKKVRKIVLETKIKTDDDDLPFNIKMKEKENFETFKRFQEIGIRLRRVLPYSQSVISERWFREKTRDDKFKQRLLKGERENRDLLSNESLIYKTLSESYEYLSNLFFSNRMLFKQMIDTLLKTKWLSPNTIDCLLAEGLNKNKKD
uniref:Protein Ycf2 n=1 Tax=Sequoia sempervirens TaxID=28980 RepID=A0A172CS24_SEQSE|nr:Ycf2 [Sequoia sempervirens]ALB37013.1 Ycf2 [Sequoia sempervirens]